MDTFEFTIEPLATIDEHVLEAMQRLAAQLNSSNQATLTTEYLEGVIASDNPVTVLVARLNDDVRTIIGIQVLVVYRLLTNVRALLENGAVDPDYTGHGVMSSLIRKAIEIADSKKVNTGRTSIGTSNDASRSMLTKLGFVPENGYTWFEFNIHAGNSF